MIHYDLLVIGTGSGNSIVDERFSAQQVAIAEAGLFGGTCLNVGCIPTKMFVHTADIAKAAAQSEKFGISTRFESADWPAIRDRIFSRIDPIEAGGRDYRTHQLPNVTVYPEHVHFTGPKSFRTATGAEFTADRVVIAAGSSPRIPHIAGLNSDRIDTPGYPVLTSDTVMRMDELPEAMTIVGGGVIAAEFAHVFSSLGVDVTVLVRGAGLLTDADETLSQRFTETFSETHSVHFGTEVTGIDVTDAGIQVTVGASSRAPTAEVPAPFTTDVLLLAAGRSPHIAGLGLEAAGIDVAKGRVAVDEFQRVLSAGAPLPGVFALGDISSPFQLKHVANHEARVVQANLLTDIAAAGVGAAAENQLQRVNHHAVPAAVFSHPQTATVGVPEAALRDAGVDYTVKVQEYGDVAYGWALEDSSGFVKVLADRHTRKILGAHIMGYQASMIIQPLIQAMAFGLPADTMANGQYWIHPALPEAVENALLGLEFTD